MTDFARRLGSRKAVGPRPVQLETSRKNSDLVKLQTYRGSAQQRIPECRHFESAVTIYASSQQSRPLILTYMYMIRANYKVLYLI